MYLKLTKNNRVNYLFLLLISFLLILKNFDLITAICLFLIFYFLTIIRKNFNKQIYQKNSELDQKNSELDQLNSELDQLNSELDQLNSELDQKNSELDQKNSELDQKNSELDEKNSELDQLNSELDQLNSELDQKNSELDQKNSELDQKNSELDQKNSELDEKNSELDQLNSELDQLNSELDQKNSELDQKNSELDQKNSELDQKNSELDEKNSELDEKNSELENIYLTNINKRFYYPKDLIFNSDDIKDSVTSFGQQGEDLVLLRLLDRGGWRSFNKTYVDAGCFHPTLYNNTYLLHLLGWQGVNIDISKKTIDLFNKSRPNDSNLLNAVYSKNNISLKLPKKIEKLSAQNSIFNYSSEEEEEFLIKTISLEYIFEKYFNNHVDYLNIDIEGSEMESLIGINFDKCKPKIISIEIHSSDGLSGGLNSESSKYLYKNGYKCVANTAITYFFVPKEIKFPSNVTNSF
jgi:peptidoglycan hydrolase CwlO-like protein